MTVEYMRDAISQVYPYPKWTERVKWMADNQVIAIYHKFLAEGKFEKKSKKTSKQVPEEHYIQLSIWDMLGGINNGYENVYGDDKRG